MSHQTHRLVTELRHLRAEVTRRGQLTESLMVLSGLMALGYLVMLFLILRGECVL